MQMQLPLFPKETKLLSDSWGVFEKDDFVYYLHNGSPVHLHHKDDIKTYRYVTATLIVNHSCSAQRLSEVFGVGSFNFNRYAKLFRKKGADAFFGKDQRRGRRHELTDEKLQQAQEMLDKGVSQLKTADKIGVSEGCIRYHLKKGNLKKKSLPIGG